MNYNSAFKTYDIRWIYKKNIDEKMSYYVWKAVWKNILDTVGKEWKFIFGSDVRLANNTMIVAFLQGMEDAGFENYFCAGVLYHNQDNELEKEINSMYNFGLCSTSMAYYLGFQDFDLWASFTASHNSKEYVWIKIFDTNAQLVNTSDLKDWIGSDIAELEDYTPPCEKQKEKIIRKSFENRQWIDELLENKILDRKQSLLNKFFGLKKNFKIVVDFSSGAGVWYEKFLLEEIDDFCGLEIIFLNEIPDSEFSAHESDTSNKNNYEQLKKSVIENNADLGVMFDGDVDRIGIVDNKWNFHPSDILVAIIANSMLKENQTDIVCDVMCSKTIDNVAEKYGVKTIKSKVGYKFVKDIILKNNAILWWELSGHILFGEFGAFEIPLLSLFYLLESLDISKNTLDEEIKNLHSYHKPWLDNYHVDDPDLIIETVKKEYSKFEQIETDWIKIVGDEFWFIIRKSNTEPIIRICMEADNKTIWENEMEKLKWVIGL